MAEWALGSPPIVQPLSTVVVTANPSTASLIAELEPTSSGLYNGLYPGSSTNAHRNFQVTWICGASTNATWRLEQCLSTGLDMSTAGRWSMAVITPSNQTAQYTHRLRLTIGDRLRVRVNSSFTGNAAAQIIAEPLE